MTGKRMQSLVVRAMALAVNACLEWAWLVLEEVRKGSLVSLFPVMWELLWV